MAEKELVLFESEDKSVSLSVPLENEMVWLNRQQMASLFDRDVKTIGRHVNNAIEEELEGIPTVANFATVQLETHLMLYGGLLLLSQLLAMEIFIL